MMAATFASRGIRASRNAGPTTSGSACSSTSNSTIWTWPFRHADHMRDGVGGLELGRHDEIDLEQSLAPDLEVLDVCRADDRLRLRRELLDEQRSDDVRLVA
jgi:hypothetical protein